MKKIFLDTNVILDLLAHRDPYFEAIAKLATLANLNQIVLVVSPLSFTTIDYILKKYEPSESVLNKLKKLASICEVCQVNIETIINGLNSGMKDFLGFHTILQCIAIKMCCNHYPKRQRFYKFRFADYDRRRIFDRSQMLIL